MRRILILIASAPVYFYRYCISPYMPMACRFQPTCSAYALEALKTHGPLKGGWLGARRIIRCHPWGGSGEDPVPAPKQRPADVAIKKCGHSGP
jgi:putative membrane protein insertion efficiency factor